MRLGIARNPAHQDPESWAKAYSGAGYRAAVSPVKNDASDSLIEDYVRAAAAHDIVIAEVGAWSNPISPKADVREAAIAHCIRQLELSEKLGARCCVNIAGSRGEIWDGPDADNFSDETFEMIVETTRHIIDAVKPERTTFALETMPWVFPDTADSYLALVKAIDRKGISVHFDPVNMISSPRIYYKNGEMIRDFIAKLGPYITNCHAKDIQIASKLTVHLEEVLPGTGALDYTTFLTELNKLDPNIPIIIEHLPTDEDYRLATEFVRKTAAELNIAL